MKPRNAIEFLIVLVLACGCASPQPGPRASDDERLYALAQTNLNAFAQQVSKDASSELGQAQAIVSWLAQNFEWKATDYQKRTVSEIVERRGGNCNELAMVALAAMKELKIKLRRVHEINIHVNTPDRGERAREMVKQKGSAYSVFGRRHNDHVWLEIYDSKANEWFPADPSSGLVGVEEWMQGRVWFGKRVTLNPITEDMIVPFAIFAADEDGKFTVNRTQHYLVEEFDRLYGGQLRKQPAWKQWIASLDLLDQKVAGAFAGNINLHEYEAQIDSLAETYERLRTSFKEKRGGQIFIFHTDEFWLNLHHFLYVLARAANKETNATRDAVVHAPADQERGITRLGADHQKVWREAVAAYAAGPSKKDLVFDDPLPAVTLALAQAGDRPSLAGLKIDPAFASILERAAPIYRKVWWKEHRDANRAWQKSIQKLVDRHGVAILAFITNAYKLDWPAAGYHVHLSGYTNWAGAYSTRGDLLVLSSLAKDIQGAYGLETIFHEGMHQWDKKVFEALREQARKQNTLVPRDLSHAMIFFTAGEAIRRVVPGHIPYAEKFGVWKRGIAPFKAAVEQVWKPYLDGSGTREEAFAELIRRLQKS